MAVGRLSVFAIDCPDPSVLARFYGAVTGWPTDDAGSTANTWVLLKSDTGATLAFQQVEDYVPPSWPGSEHPQHAHVDVDVVDLDVAEAEVLELGAHKAEVQPGTGFRVFLDPAGHPFCLVLAAAG